MTKTDKRRDRYYRSKYGITLKTYNDKLWFQEDRCALCKRHKNNFKRRFAVDHNHKTGQVRGLVCFYCNKFIIGRHNLTTAFQLHNYMVVYDG